MALFINLDGTGLPEGRVRLASGFTISEGASVGQTEISNITFDDSDGSLTVTGLKDLWLSESTASPQRICTASVWDRTIKRSPTSDRTGAGRIWECQVRDLQERLNRRLGRAKAYQRPAETDIARLTFLVGSSILSGLVYDLGLANATDNPVNLDASNYVGRTAMDMLVDMAPVSGKTAFVYWDESAGKAGLFYDVPLATGHDSSLKISNVLADVDNSVTFSPNDDASMVRSPQDTHSAILFNYRGNYVYATRPATQTAFAESEVLYSTDRVGRAATATTLATQYLVDHSVEFDTITCTLELPAAHVNDVRAGMRVQVKFSHFPGYSGFTWTRVIKRTIAQREDQTTYTVTLELSASVKTGIPGGGTDIFPNQPGPVSLVQSKSSAGTTINLDTTPTPGNILLGWAAIRSGGWDARFTLIASVTNGVRSGSMVYRVVLAGDPAAGWAPPGQSYSTIMEWAADTVDSNASQSDHAAATNITAGGALTPTAGKSAAIIGGSTIGQSDVRGDSSATANAPWVQLASGRDNAGSPWSNVMYQIVPSTSGAYTPSATITGAADDFGGVTVALTNSTAASLPPQSGQWVYNETPTPATDGSTTVFTLANAYASGSLRIRVDGVLISPAAYSETSTTTFTLNWAPDAGEALRVDYQGL